MATPPRPPVCGVKCWKRALQSRSCRESAGLGDPARTSQSKDGVTETGCLQGALQGTVPVEGVISKPTPLSPGYHLHPCFSFVIIMSA